MDIKMLMSNLDLASFPIMSKILEENQEEILNEWLLTTRVQYSLDHIGLTVDEFKIQYAEAIFNVFYNIVKTKILINKCPVIIHFLEYLESFDNASQLVILICTQFKNAITKVILRQDIPLKEKEEVFSMISLLLDVNLSNTLLHHTLVLNNMRNERIAHAKLLEESTIASKTDTQGVITFISDSFCEIMGYSREELVGQNHNIVRHPDSKAPMFKRMWDTIQNGKIWKGKLKNLTKDGKTIIINTEILPEYNHKHEIVGYVAVRSDVTDKFLARTDKLTRVMNRLRFDEELARKIELSSIEDKELHMIVMDIDKFKIVNDTYGHVVGDKVLQEFAKEIKKVIRPSDIFARWGGEEFAMVLYGVDFDTALSTAERMRKQIESAEFEAVGKVTASFGVAQYSMKYEDFSNFFSKVDECLYNSKAVGRNVVSYLDDKDGVIKIVKKD